jgi:hypothetical protein
MFSAPVV